MLSSFAAERDFGDTARRRAERAGVAWRQVPRPAWLWAFPSAATATPVPTGLASQRPTGSVHRLARLGPGSGRAAEGLLGPGSGHDGRAAPRDGRDGAGREGARWGERGAAAHVGTPLRAQEQRRVGGADERLAGRTAAPTGRPSARGGPGRVTVPRLRRRRRDLGLVTALCLFAEEVPMRS